VEICINDDVSPLLICRVPAPIEELSLGQLLRCVSKLQMRSGIIHDSPFQIVYRNRQAERIPVTNQFPYDTDYSWNRLCLSRFWIVPILTAGVDGACENHFAVWHFVGIDNTMRIAEGMGLSVL
jgi:hypothetical protein